MAQPKFKVGDVCRVKDYDVLLSECDRKDSDDDLVFYIGEDDNLYYYYSSDTELCGRQFTITDVKEEYDGVFVYLSEEISDDENFEDGWLFEDALELDVPEGPSVDSANLVQNLCDLFEGVA